MKKKATIVLTALALVLCFAIGGTLAWLVDTTDPVVNTFTYGDVDIALEETTGDEYKMVPGNKIAKDPKVTVAEGSEDCWLFVKIEKSANYDTYLEPYELNSNWNALDETKYPGVYYCEAKAGDSLYVLASGGTGYEYGYVQVNNKVTKNDMLAIKESNMPTLTFTAYAVQKANVADAVTAWGIANPTTTTN